MTIKKQATKNIKHRKKILLDIDLYIRQFNITLRKAFEKGMDPKPNILYAADGCPTVFIKIKD